MLDVPSRDQEYEPTPPGHLTEALASGLCGRLFQFVAVPTREGREALEIVTVPTAQLRTRGYLLHRFVVIVCLPGQPAGPRAVHKHPMTARLAPRILVHVEDIDPTRCHGITWDDSPVRRLRHRASRPDSRADPTPRIS